MYIFFSSFLGLTLAKDNAGIHSKTIFHLQNYDRLINYEFHYIYLSLEWHESPSRKVEERNDIMESRLSEINK